jgi:hypothetical protein
MISQDLQLYLLQLVQALKFENLAEAKEIADSPLCEFLVGRAILNPNLGNYFYWFDSEPAISLDTVVLLCFLSQVPHGRVRR